MRALCASFLFSFFSRQHPLPISRLKSSIRNQPPLPALKFPSVLRNLGTDTAFKLTNTSAPEGIASFLALNPASTECPAHFGFKSWLRVSRRRLRTFLLIPMSSRFGCISPRHRKPLWLLRPVIPSPAEESGADVSTLENGQLETMQPVAANDAVRFLPGAVVNTAGQRGGLSSLFVRGGESNYNKVIVDGVTINEPGGTFDFGTLPLTEANRMEFLRGTQSTLYGSDAMTSVVQVFTRTGSTRTPELLLGADGGNFSTANGNAAISGARGRFDYNFFGDQFNTNGSGINNAYSDSLQGANVGVAINEKTSLRLHMRHSNSHTGVPGEWSFNGYDPPVDVNGVMQPLPPDPNEWSQLNSLLGSVELTVAEPSGWQHHFTGFDYLYRYNDVNLNGDPDRVSPLYGQFDFPDHEYDNINRAGFEYQGNYSERNWAQSTFGYRVENENGFVGSVGAQTPGQRLNQDAYLQQQITWGRLSVVAGGRFVHSSVFGNTGVPRVALTLLARRGGEIFSGTRLRFSYATGYKEPRLEETFAGPPYSIPNPGLKPERVRAFEAGFQQNFYSGKYVLNADVFQQPVSRSDQLRNRRSYDFCG